MVKKQKNRQKKEQKNVQKKKSDITTAYKQKRKQLESFVTL